MLRGGVGKREGLSLEASGRADHDEATAFAALKKMWEHCLHGVERASEVDVDDVLPLILCEFVGPGPVENACVGNNGGDATEFVDASLCKCLQLRRLTHVDVVPDDALAGGLNKTNGFSEIFGCRRHDAAGTNGTADVADDDIGALFGHAHCVRTTLPASGSGDECDLASETTHNIPLAQ